MPQLSSVDLLTTSLSGTPQNAPSETYPEDLLHLQDMPDS